MYDVEMMKHENTEDCVSVERGEGEWTKEGTRRVTGNEYLNSKSESKLSTAQNKQTIKQSRAPIASAIAVLFL